MILKLISEERKWSDPLELFHRPLSLLLYRLGLGMHTLNGDNVPQENGKKEKRGREMYSFT